MNDDWDYAKELDDEVDTLQFGKYKGLTPAEVAFKDSNYIVWATQNTHHWVGSDELVERIFKLKKIPMTKAPPPSTKADWKPVEDFEEAMYEAYGEYPVRANRSIPNEHQV